MTRLRLYLLWKINEEDYWDTSGNITRHHVNRLITADQGIMIVEDDYPVRMTRVGGCSVEANDMDIEFRTAISSHKLAKEFKEFRRKRARKRALKEFRKGLSGLQIPLLSMGSPSVAEELVDGFLETADLAKAAIVLRAVRTHLVVCGDNTGLL